MTQSNGMNDAKRDGKRKRRPGRPSIAGPTARQVEILEFIRAASQAERRPPSIDEIRRHFNFQSTNAVRAHLQSMEKKGLLRIARGSHRGISLPDDSGAREFHSRLVPLLGEAAAGAPIEAIERIDEHVALDGGLFPHPDIFALRVRGDSMIDAGINHQDLALIRPCPDAKDGDLVLARLNGDVTIKRLRLEKGRIALHPENPAYKDIRIGKDDDFSIVGTIAGIIRKY